MAMRFIHTIATLPIAAIILSGCGGGSGDPTRPVFTLPPAPAVQMLATPGTGGIFRADAGHAPLVSGQRAGRVGDIVTIALVERVEGNRAAQTTTGRNGSIGLKPPATGPLALVAESDLKLGGGTSFSGKGETRQSSRLAGTITVTVTEVRPGGILKVEGERRMVIGRGPEVVRLSGLVRAADIGPDNIVPSSRIAGADIAVVGKGQVSDAARAGWLQRLFDTVSPF